MAPTNVVSPTAYPPATTPATHLLAAAVILGTITFNAALAFINGFAFHTSASVVMASEALLLLGAGLACRNELTLSRILLIVLMIVYTLSLAMLRHVGNPDTAFDIKTARDLVIPVIFFLLGREVGDVRMADKIVYGAAALLLAFALLELFALQTYLSIFKVIDYYIARGSLTAGDSGLKSGGGLFVSGMRPADQGRALLPFLSGHRVSSLFLEPITLGNYGAIIALWAAVRSRMQGKFFFFGFAAGVALIFLSDTRLAAGIVALGLIVMVTPARITTPAVFALPFVLVIGLCFLAAYSDPVQGVPDLEGRGTYHRLLFSGRILMDFNVYNWFGLSPSRVPTNDTGYAYLINNIGIVGFAALWTLFMSLRSPNPYFYVFRNIMGVFFAMLLCISASLFTIKLAGTLWFLVGVLSMQQMELPRKKSSPKRVRRGGQPAPEPGWIRVPDKASPNWPAGKTSDRT